VFHESSDGTPQDISLHFRDVGESESDRSFPSPLRGITPPLMLMCRVGSHLISFDRLAAEARGSDWIRLCDCSLKMMSFVERPPVVGTKRDVVDISPPGRAYSGD